MARITPPPSIDGEKKRRQLRMNLHIMINVKVVVSPSQVACHSISPSKCYVEKEREARTATKLYNQQQSHVCVDIMAFYFF